MPQESQAIKTQKSLIKKREKNLKNFELTKLLEAELHAVYVIRLVSPPSSLDIKTNYDLKSYLSTDVSIEGLKRILRKEGDEAIKYVENLAKKEGMDVRKWILSY